MEKVVVDLLICRLLDALELGNALAEEAIADGLVDSYALVHLRADVAQVRPLLRRVHTVELLSDDGQLVLGSMPMERDARDLNRSTHAANSHSASNRRRRHADSKQRGARV